MVLSGWLIFLLLEKAAGQSRGACESHKVDNGGGPANAKTSLPLSKRFSW